MAPFVKKLVYSDPMVDYLNYAHDVRGRIVNNVAEMEQELDNYICSHFCDTKQKRSELQEIIISTKHISFSGKASIARFILEKREDATSKEATKIWRHLMESIAPKRNMIAHFALDDSISSLRKFKEDNTTIYFLKYSNTKAIIPFTKKDMLSMMDITFSVKQFFWGLSVERYQREKK